MKYYISFIIFILINFNLFAVNGISGGNPKVLKYHQPIYNYYFFYPNSWTLNDSNGEVLVKTQIDFSNYYYNEMRISVNDNLLRPTMSANEKMETLKSFLQTTYPTLKWNRSNVNSMPHLVSRTTTASNKIKRQYFFIFGNIIIKADILFGKNSNITKLIHMLSSLNNINEYLFSAIDDNNFQEVSWAINNGADVNSRRFNNHSFPIFYAAYEADTRIMKLLLDNGADIHTRGSSQDRSVLFPAVRSGPLETVKLLIDYGINIHLLNVSLRNALFIAVWKGKLDVTQLLLSYGADPNIQDFIGLSPLMAAIAWNNPNKKKALMELLLSYGAHIDYKDKKGKDALLYLSANFCSSIGNTIEGIEWPKMLIDKGANVNTSSDNGITPLMLIARCANYKVLNYLLNNNANIHAKNIQGKTVLMYAASYCCTNTEKVRLLLQKGVKVNARNNKGHTALYYAKKCGAINTAKIIMQYGGIL